MLFGVSCYFIKNREVSVIIYVVFLLIKQIQCSVVTSSRKFKLVVPDFFRKKLGPMFQLFTAVLIEFAGADERIIIHRFVLKFKITKFLHT